MRTRKSPARHPAGYGPLALLALLAAVLPVACSDGGTGPGETDVDADMDEYVGSLGSWTAFAPPLETSEGATGPETRIDEVVDDVTYECSVTPYSLTDTPEKIVMFEPNASIMWVGNLIQGKSYKGGAGSFQELSIRQRTPLKISIDLLTGDNFAIVENPSLTSVQTAIGGLIQKAADAGHLSGSSIHYESTRNYSALGAFLRMGMSASLVGLGIPGELSASSEFEANASVKGIMANFTQKMFTISIELPQSSGDFFSEELTPALLQQQVDAGNIGSDNLPVYIASITYGRTLTYSLFSEESEIHLHAAVEASMTGVGEAEIAMGLDRVLQSERLKLTAIGGEGDHLISLIRSGELSQFFTADASLTSARPISYQLNFLGDNSIAKVSETVAYDVRECNEKAVNPGLFEFLPAQTMDAGVGVPYRVVAADINGDGHGDVVLNHRGPGGAGVNQIRVGLGTGGGTFNFGSVQAHPATPGEGWANGYDMYVGDFNGDGRDDLVWNRRQEAQPNKVYAGLSNGDGTFQWQDVQAMGGNWATGWQTHVDDATGDGRDDLVFTYLTTSARTVVAVSQGNGMFTPAPLHDHGGGWDNFSSTFVTDVNGDGRADIIRNTQPGYVENHVSVWRSVGGGDLAGRVNKQFSAGWHSYKPHIGDVNGDGRSDMLWTQSTANTFYVHRALGNADGHFDFGGAISTTRPEIFGEVGEVPAAIGDFNGDGRADILFNELTATTNGLVVGLGNGSGGVDFSTVAQAHSGTSTNWTQYGPGPLVLDVNNDGRDDIVWSTTSVDNRIHVALGREPDGE